jgi:hypothetical protein
LGSTSKFRTRSNPEAAPRNTDGAASDSQTWHRCCIFKEQENRNMALLTNN